MAEDYPQCARCPYPPAKRICQQEDGQSPPYCPTTTREAIIQRAYDTVQETPEVFEFAKQASAQEALGYDKEAGYEKAKPINTRVAETIEFAKRMKYKRLGLVFCIGLRKEAKVMEMLLTEKGFEVVSVMCKAGRIPKSTLGLDAGQTIRGNVSEAMCNPVAQAMLLNDSKTEFNIAMGLCVGHDSLLFKYVEAPTTVLLVKDRVTGHNPVAVLYTVDSYYRALK